MKFSEFKKIIDERIATHSSGEPHSRLQNLEIILEIVNKINSTLILDEVLELVLKNAITFTKSERGFIVLSGVGGGLEYKIGLDAEGNRLSKDTFQVSMSVIEEVYKSGASKFVESALSDTSGEKSESIFMLELETILCSPLISGEKKLGVLYVDSTSLQKINIQEITDTFEILAGQAATAIRNAQFFNGQLQAYNALQESNQQLTKAKEDAEKSDRLKSEFLAQMSHEIRTPIHILMSYSSLIKDEIEDSLDEDLRSNFNAIDDAGKRIIRTTDLILNMSEIQTGNYEYDAVEFNIFDEVLVSIYNEFKDMANSMNIEFTLNQLSETASIVADKYSVYQIFTNLIDNAFKYTPSGRIEVNYFRDKKSLPTVEVIDTGIGIAKQYIPNLFKPFTQEEQGYNRRFEGNGLGLALVKSYCDMNNATIKVKTVKNFGSTFTVKFNSQTQSKE